MIKDKYKRNIQPGNASKVDYIRVLNDLQMQLTAEGGFNWGFTSPSSKASPYRVTISKVPDYEETLSMMMTNRGSPRA